MLDEISRHAVGFNLHAEVAGDFAANVRMFEVTGAGALLVTDHKKNIGDLFEPGSEILTYKDREECMEKLKWALDNPVEAAEIAAAGQRRTLRDHTVEKRVDLLYDIMEQEFSKQG
jgi:spore maturation protein CgeB